MKNNSIYLLLLIALTVLNSCGQTQEDSNDEVSKKDLKIEEFESLLAENDFDEAKAVLEELEDSKYSVSDDEMFDLLGDFKNTQFKATVDMIDLLIEKGEFNDAETHHSSLLSHLYEDDQISKSSQDYLYESMGKLINARKELLKPYQSEIEGKLNDLVNVSDEFSDVKWMEDPTTPKYNNKDAFFLYFGIKEDNPTPLRLRIQYLGDDWLFIKGYILLIDSEKYQLIVDDMERDNGSGDIWEWSDELLSDYSYETNMEELMVEIINSDEAKIKFVGDQYYDVRTITQKEKEALKSVILGYVDAGGNFDSVINLFK